MGELASTRGWGSGWPYCQSSRVVVVTWTQPHGTRLSVPVRSEMRALFPALIDRLAVARGRDYSQYGTWGYCCRAIGGTNTPSNHSWGLAVDLEAPSNPQGSYTRGSQPAAAGAIASALGFRWGGPTGLGGGYTSYYDCMHYEFMGTPAQAAALSANLTPQPQIEDDMPKFTDVVPGTVSAKFPKGVQYGPLLSALFYNMLQSLGNDAAQTAELNKILTQTTPKVGA